MTTNNADNREIQRDARAWAKFTDIKYTAALRLMQHPLAQGILGPRISARDLIRVLDEHPVVGRAAGVELGPWGLDRGDSFTDNPTGYVDVVLAAEVLRMFRTAEPPEVGSYGMKHRAEKFLGGDHSYISNGQAIWAAAVLGLRLEHEDADSPNVLIGLDRDEVAYVRRIQDNREDPVSDHHRPPGYAHLRAAIDAYNADGTAPSRWDGAIGSKSTSEFHEWLIARADIDADYGSIELLAADYAAGVRDGDHDIAHTAADLVRRLQEMRADDSFHEAAHVAGEAFRADEAAHDRLRRAMG